MTLANLYDRIAKAKPNQCLPPIIRKTKVRKHAVAPDVVKISDGTLVWTSARLSSAWPDRQPFEVLHPIMIYGACEGRAYLTLMGSKRHFAPPIDRQSFMEVDGVVAGRRYCTREGTAFFGAGWNEPVWLEISKEELEALEDNHALLLENGCDQPRLRSKVVPLQQTRRNAGEAVPLKRIPSSTKLLPRWKP